MLYHSTCYTVLLIRHHFCRIPAVLLRKYLKLPAFRGAVLAKRSFILRAWVRCGLFALFISRDRSSTTALLQCTVPCPQHRLNYRNMPVGRENALLFFSLSLCASRTWSNARSSCGGAFRGRTRSASQAPTQQRTMGFPGSWSREQYPQSRYCTWIQCPGKCEQKRSHSLAPFHGIIVDAYSTVTLSALTVDETSSNQPRLPLMVRYNSYEYCTCINHCSLAWPRLLCCNRRSSWPHDMIYN